jgi:multidrug resistance efflux pump
MLQRRVRLSAILACVVAGLVLLGCSANLLPGESQAASLSLLSLQSQQPVDVVSAQAVVVPVKKAYLSFKVAGRVQDVLVEEGDLVTAGQELAELDTTDLQRAVLQAQAKLSSAQAELAKAQAGARPEEIASAEAAVAIFDARIKAAEQAASVVEGNLATTQADVQAAQDAVAVIEGELAAAQARLAGAQAALAKLLAGATPREIQIAQKQVDLANKEWARLQRKRDETRNVIEGEIAAAQTKAEIAQLQLQKLKDAARPEDVAAARAQVSQAQAEVKTTTAQLAQARIEVTKAQASVQTVEAQLSQADAQVESAKAQSLQAQAQLDLVKAGTRPEDIAVAQAAVAQAEAALAEAQNAVEDAVLRAPFAGTIGAILVDEGESVLAQVPVIRVGDLSQLQVETEDLSEVDVDRVGIGRTALVTADALGGDTFQGTVSKIAPAATDYHGDTVYTVTVDLGVGPESGLRWGMSTFVEIQVH